MTQQPLYLVSIVVAFATWILLVAGGLVTSTGSGLSVPDWPLSYGQFFPPMVGGIRFEHSHRMIAAVVGFLTLGLTVLFLMKEKRRWVRRLAVIALAAVLLQAILGGITVLYLLPTAVSVMHACLGQSFFCLVMAMALFSSGEWEKAPALRAAHGAAFKRLSLTTTVFIYSQLVAGAMVRHTGGRGIEIHLFLAFFILIHLFFLNLKVFKDPTISRAFLKQMLLVDGLFVAQLFLGLGSFVFKLVLEKAPVPRLWEVLLTTAHQSTGALILATSVLMTLRAFRFLRNEKAGAYSSEYLQLMKPRVTLMALATTWVGYGLASSGLKPDTTLWHTLLGAFLIGGGANALNQYLEKDIDAKMKRTENRPIPSGRLKPESARLLGWVCALLGFAELIFFVSPLCGLLGLGVFVSYVFCYTPLKRTTTLNTFVGAIPGALPIVLGYAAGSGREGHEALALFLMLFLWQLPHFFAIAWFYREDYRRGGLRMLPAEDPSGSETARHIIFYAALLIPATLLPFRLGMAGLFYFWAALLSGTAIFVFSLVLARGKLILAKKFVGASICHLAALMVFLLADKR